MQWSRELDEEFEELMDDYSQLEPALERACRTEDQLEQVHAVLPKIMELMLDLARRLGRQETMEGQ